MVRLQSALGGDGAVGRAVGPAVTGFIVQSTGAFTSAFVLAGAIAIAGVSCVLIFVRPIAVEHRIATPATGVS